jgi:hypothetical protein
MSQHVAEALGWVATAVFVGSYFFRRIALLRALQMLGSALWIAYGILIAAKPVIAANVLVFAAAGWTLLRSPRAPQPPNRGVPARIKHGAEGAARNSG